MRRGLWVGVICAVVMFLAHPAFGLEKGDYQFKCDQSFRIDRQGEHSESVTRAEGQLIYKWPMFYQGGYPEEERPWELRIRPFSEARYDFDDENWNRIEAGGELGIDMVRFLYWGEGLHYAFRDPQSDVLELETRLVLEFPFWKKALWGRDVTMRLLEEHTFDFDIGEGSRNEIGGFWVLPMHKNFEAACGWRHIDRIHDFDTDQIELMGTFLF